ncbi:discoidin domain-containing protein [Solibaculum mannosilyticum]|uniref:discoidin domain-containing protein n=1 Tax=Solibaculum mannosilyticum TaxID=2780922 RepID=UPI0034AE9301
MNIRKRVMAILLSVMMVVSAVLSSPITLAEDDTGDNLALLPGNSFSAKSSENGRGPELAFDGDMSSRWAQDGNGEAGRWVQITFAEEQIVSKTTVYFESMTKGYVTNPVLDGKFEIQYSDDGSQWNTLVLKDSFTDEEKTSKIVSLSFDPVSTRYMRIYFPESQFWLSIYEWELYSGITIVPGDTGALQDLVEQVEPKYVDTIPSQFKMSAVNNYKNALDDAKDVLAMTIPPEQADIDVVYNALDAAVKGLEDNRTVFPDALKATPAEDWNELFNNLDNPDEDDWRAGDGMVSVPLNGVDAIGSGDENTPTVWMFSDSYVSSFKDLSQSLLLNWLQMPNHVFAEFDGVTPDKSKLEFIFGEGGDKSKLRNPPTENDEGGTSNVVPEMFWIQDGIAIGDHLYVLSGHEDALGGGEFKTTGVSMVKFPIGEDYQVDWAGYEWLGFKNDLFSDTRIFATSILDNTVESGIDPEKADGYVYLYGATNGVFAERCAVVARTTKENIENPDLWEFYTEEGWKVGAKDNLDDTKIITPRMLLSSKVSVTYLNSGIYEGKYLMTYTDGALSEKIGYMLADNPWGPFENPTICYVAPEMEQYQNELYEFDNPDAWYVTYNPVAHPQLSKDGELLISYDCYVWDSNKDENPNWHGTETNEHYRERFFRLDLNSLQTVEEQPYTNLVSEGKPVTSTSGDHPEYATDGDDFTKWESTGEESVKQLTIDLEEPTVVGRYILKHGGLAIVNDSDKDARNYSNTRAFTIEVSLDNQNWTTVVDKRYNASFQNDENFDPTLARYVRLSIDQPTQGTMNKASIFEFQVYATDMKYYDLDDTLEQAQSFQQVNDLNRYPASDVEAFLDALDAAKQCAADEDAAIEQRMEAALDLHNALDAIAGITFDDVDKGVNLASGKDVTASSGDHPEYAIDGDDSTVWKAENSDLQWLSIDLGQLTTIDRVILHWGQSYARSYNIQVSRDGENWENVYDIFNAPGGVDDIFFAPTEARYVRVYGTTKTGDGDTLSEIEVYAPYDMSGDAYVSASSADASLAVDGDDATAWTSDGKSNQWIGLDLGSVQRVGSLGIHWGDSFASSYKIQVSDDSLTWTDAYTTQNGRGGTETVNLSPITPTHYATEDGTRDINVQHMTARYIRLVPMAGAGDDFSIAELDVYGSPALVIPDTQNDTAILEEISLNDGWKLARVPDIDATPAAVSSPGFDTDNDLWIDAVVPGTVLTSYYEAGLIDDPYYSDNMDKLDQDYYNVDYWYRKDIDLPADYAGQRMILNIDGVNWLSDIYVNGQPVANLMGAFKSEELDVSQYLVPGQVNTIAVNVHIFPTGKDEDQTRWSPHFISSGSWDWIPAIPGRNIGIVKDVSLSTRKAVSVDAPFVATDLPLPNTDYADIRVSADLHNSSSQDVTGVIKGVINPGNVTFEQEVTIPAGDTLPVTLDHETFEQLRIQSPLLWWPNGYGDQNLYTLDLCYEIDGTVSHSQQVTFGIREYTYDYTDDPDQNMQISCNGVRIMAKGGNWGMPDAMLSWGDEEYDTAVKMHKDMNFTMIRDWLGTADFDAFYEACDKYGIMVYTDFWIHGAYAPEAFGAFLENAYNKLERVRNHASVVIWCGANEWTPAGALNTLLPQMAAELDDTRIYITQSNKDEVSGGVTYAVNDPAWYYDAAKESKGFTTEIGTPVIPNYESMKEMMEEEYWWPPTDESKPFGKNINYMWQYHDLGGASDIGNKGAEKYINEINNRYGESEGLEEFTLKAQMINLETNKAMFEAWNNYMWEKCSGILLWMSQSAWPSTVWQTYDSSFDVTGAYFGSKIGSEPIHVQYDYKNHDVKVINNTNDTLSGVKVFTEVYNLDGTLYDKLENTLDAAPNSANQVVNIATSLNGGDLSTVHFVKLTLTDADGKVLSSNFYWRNKRGLTDYTDMETLPDVALTASKETTVQDGVTNMKVTLTNNTDTVAVMTRLKVMKGDTEQRVLPTMYDDNYFALVPGETKVINIQFDTEDAEGYEPTLKMEGFNTTAATIEEGENSAWYATSVAQQSDGEEGGIDVLTTVVNPTGAQSSANVVASVYDQSGKMLSTSIQEVSFADGQTKASLWFGALDTAGQQEGIDVKVFVLSDSASPLTKAMEPVVQPVRDHELNANLAFRKPVTASSVGDNNPPENAVDGSLSTRWSSSYNDNQWIMVDLEEETEISRVDLYWEAAYADHYRIEVSTTGTDDDDFTVVYEDSQSTGGSQSIDLEPVKARYVRIYCISRATMWGSSLHEIEIYR